MNPVLRENLEMGKLYYIEYLDQDNKMKMIGIFRGLILVHGPTGPWKQAEFDWYPVSQMHVKDPQLYTVRLNFYWRFYKVDKFKIQCDMESRAINLYLQQHVVFDPWFNY